MEVSVVDEQTILYTAHNFYNLLSVGVHKNVPIYPDTIKGLMLLNAISGKLANKLMCTSTEFS